VWQKSHEVTLAVYKATSSFPTHELYGLTSQLRRASASIPANIAEGCGRASQAELAHFMTIAMGSATELAYHLILARDLGYLHAEDYVRLGEAVDQVQRMLRAYITKLRSKDQQLKANS
jgi:four helix bundle protein